MFESFRPNWAFANLCYVVPSLGENKRQEKPYVMNAEGSTVY